MRVLGVVAVLALGCGGPDRREGGGGVDANTNPYDTDTDGDGIPDAFDACPGEYEYIGDDGDGCPDFRTIRAVWTLRTVSGAAAACPPGYDTVALYNVRVDSNGAPLSPNCTFATASGVCFVDLFACGPTGGAVSAPIPPGRYQSWIAVTDYYGAQVYAQSLSTYVLLEGTDLEITTSIVTDGGYFSLDWMLAGANTNAPLSCNDAGATEVELVATVSGGSTIIDTPWPCADGRGVTNVMAAGSYTVSIDAFAGGGAVGTATPLANQLIMAPNKVTSLGTVTIPITGM